MVIAAETKEREKEKEKEKERGDSTPPSKRQLFRKGSKVEVCTNEEGFKDAWFVATVLDFKSYSPKTKQTTKPQVLVKYDTLLSDDDKSKPLIECVDFSSIRPLPPRASPEKEECFESYDVVDAFYRDGWWKGVISEVATDGRNKKRRDKCYNVVFENPPHQIKFGPSQLRFHFDWVNGSWDKPPKQKRMQGLNFSKGMTVEVNIGGQYSNEVWLPATILDEVGFNSFLVAPKSTDTNNDCSLSNMAVDSFHIRPPPPLDFDLKDFELLEKVDALCGSGWRDGFITKNLSDDRFMVMLKPTMEERQFTRSEIRPHMYWINGKWVSFCRDQSDISVAIELLRDPDNNSENALVGSAVKSHAKESPSINSTEKCIEQSNASPAKQVSWKVKQRALESEPRHARPSKRTRKEVKLQKDVDVDVDASCEDIGAEEHIVPEGGNGDLDDQGCVELPITVWDEPAVKEKNNMSEGGASDENNQDYAIKKVGLPIETCAKLAGSVAETSVVVPTVDYAVEKVHVSETSSDALIDCQPLSLCYEGNGHVDTEKHLVTKGGEAGIQSIVLLDDIQSLESNHVPLIRSSPIWKVVESMEAFQHMPQQPHFLPLVKYNEEIREGMAIGYMITFATVVEKTSKLEVDDPTDPISRYMQTLTDLETLGFDVKIVMDRLKKLLLIKQRRGLLQELSKEVDDQIAEHSKKKSKLEEDIEVVKTKLRALEEKRASYITMKLEKELEIASLQENVDLIKKKLSNAENEFRDVAAASFYN